MLFLDSSALVKLYVAERGSGEVCQWAEGQRMALSVLAHAEVHAAFARRRREERHDDRAHAALLTRFNADWSRRIQVPVSPAVLALVPDLCRRHPLRGMDAVQLASALVLFHPGLALTFGCADGRLNDAARAEGLDVFEPAASLGMER